MGAPLGNQNWKAREQRRLVTSALEREIVQFESAPRGIKAGEAASKLARNIVEMALDGDKWAIEFICDRTEGKPKQSTAYEHSGTVSVEHIGVEEVSRLITERLSGGSERSISAPVLN